MLAYELTRWWAYRRIKHPMMKAYLWAAPLTLSAVVLAFYVLLPVKPSLGGDAGLLRSVSQILALLPGFFISALAAVATFARAEMDMPMAGNPPPKADIHHRGSMVEVELTRRMFLTYLFSYLAILSIGLFIALVIAPYVAPSVMAILVGVGASNFIVLPKYIYLVVVVYFMSSLLISTLHGVYFLCERIHMPNS